jgi:ATP-dependent DNA ligase
MERDNGQWVQTFPMVKAVQQFNVSDEAGVTRSCKAFCRDGFEGGMIRQWDAPYIEKRCNELLKSKPFIDDEFEIIDIEEGVGNRSGMMGRIKMKTKEGQVFDASCKGHPPEFATAFDYYRHLLEKKDEYIGKMATVEFQNYSPPPRKVPRIIRGVKAIRDYE